LTHQLFPIRFANYHAASGAQAFLMEHRQGEHERGDGWRIGMMFRVPLQRSDLPRASARGV
jgi:hypothetical protein